MNPSSTSFDIALKEIPHYKSFPAMMPYIGKDYISPIHSKLLILGESFYLPEESTVHLDAVQWYSSNESLLSRCTEIECEDEVKWINCRGLLEDPWNQPGHKMYRELNACLGELNLPSHDRAVSHICYTNTFMRPAIEGASLKKICVPQDFAVSIEVLTKVISILTPDLVIFASKWAWDSIGWIIEERVSGSSFDFVSHPAGHFSGRFWNGPAYPHGRKKFISLLKKWASKIE